MKNNLIKFENPIEIQNLIYTVRGKQVMLDSDLAKLYQVETRVLNQAVKRNIKRFPEKYMFQLTKEEYEFLMSQIVISKNKETRGGRQKLPYAFTEQGISMLSAILKSDTAIEISIKIIDTFVEMRKHLLINGEIFSRLDKIETKQIENKLEADKKFEEIFNYIASKQEITQKIFFENKIYDAFSLIVEIIQKARKEIILIDNYVDVNTLNILAKSKEKIKIKIFTHSKTNLTEKDIEIFNKQYKNLSVNYTKEFHDRFLILDSKICYLIGASIKDAGKKTFGIVKIEDVKSIKEILNRLKK